jgi:hypothetical protein
MHEYQSHSPRNKDLSIQFYVLYISEMGTLGTSWISWCLITYCSHGKMAALGSLGSQCTSNRELKALSALVLLVRSLLASHRSLLRPTASLCRYRRHYTLRNLFFIYNKLKDSKGLNSNLLRNSNSSNIL